MVKKVVVFAGHDHDTWEKLRAKGVLTDLEADGVYEEYDTNFLIAKGAVKILRTVPGLIVYFPQEDGRRMTLKQRVDYANSIGADLMIDIHSNAAASRTATGAAAFYWKGSVNGKKAADIYASHLKTAGFPLWSGGTYASNTADGWSGFYMLRYSNMPAILLENFFFTTRSDLEKYLLNPAVQMTLMEIVADTATDYFGIKKPTPKPVSTVKPAAPIVVPVSNEKEEEITLPDLLKLSTNEGKNAQLRVLKRFEKKEPALSNIWREKVENDEFTLHDFAEVFFVAVDRGYITGLVNTDALQERVEALESKIGSAVK